MSELSLTDEDKQRMRAVAEQYLGMHETQGTAKGELVLLFEMLNAVRPDVAEEVAKYGRTYAAEMREHFSAHPSDLEGNDPLELGYIECVGKIGGLQELWGEFATRNREATREAAKRTPWGAPGFGR